MLTLAFSFSNSRVTHFTLIKKSARCNIDDTSKSRSRSHQVPGAVVNFIFGSLMLMPTLTLGIQAPILAKGEGGLDVLLMVPECLGLTFCCCNIGVHLVVPYLELG